MKEWRGKALRVHDGDCCSGQVQDLRLTVLKERTLFSAVGQMETESKGLLSRKMLKTIPDLNPGYEHGGNVILKKEIRTRTICSPMAFKTNL